MSPILARWLRPKFNKNFLSCRTGALRGRRSLRDLWKLRAVLPLVGTKICADQREGFAKQNTGRSTQSQCGVHVQARHLDKLNARS